MCTREFPFRKFRKFPKGRVSKVSKLKGSVSSASQGTWVSEFPKQIGISVLTACGFAFELSSFKPVQLSFPNQPYLGSDEKCTFVRSAGAGWVRWRD